MYMSKRIYYLDILRVIACLSVIMIHVCAPYAAKEFGSLNFWAGNILDGLARIGVPLFVMISGSLMLDKNYQISKDKLKKRILKMILFFIFWSIIYFIIFDVILAGSIRHGQISISKIITSLISGYSHLWFIYLIIGLYLIVPILRLWVTDNNKKYVEYFLILAVIFTYIIPEIANIGSLYFNLFRTVNEIINDKLILQYVGGYTTYFILGWYISNYDLKNKNIIYLCGLIGLYITIMGTYTLSLSEGRYVGIPYSNLSINILFQTAAVFVFIKDKFKNTTNKIIDSISKRSLGIYAIHYSIISIMYEILNNFHMDNALINIPMIFITSFIISYIISLIMSKIPLLKKYV